MTGTSSTVGAVGSVFESKNPRMDSQRPQEQPASIPVFVVNGKPYFTEREAQRAAEGSTRWDDTPTEIKVGTFHLDGLQHFKSVTPAEAASAAAERAAKLGIETDETTEADAVVSDLDETETETETTIVEAAPMKASDKPQTWHSPAIHPDSELQLFPTEGLFSPEEWGAVIGCSPMTVERHLHTFGIGLVDGKISAAKWWETLANADTKTPPAKKTFWRTQRTFGIVTVSVNDWKPKNARAVPPSLTDGLGMWLSSRYAMLFNASPVAIHRSHWACTTTRGTIIVLAGIRLQDRPVDVSDFPRCVQGGLTFHEAEQMTEAANTPRMEFSRVPKEWCVAVRMANTIEAEVMDA